MSGLMYFDCTNIKLEDKIKWGERRYYEKFGKYPNVVWLNPKMGLDNTLVGSVEVRTHKAIMMHNFLIGEYGDSDQPPAPVPAS